MPLGLTPIFIFGGNNFLFNVDFSLLISGGISSSDFLEQTDLIFTRGSGSTVQTNASTLISGLGTDVACIGSPDGVSKGLSIQDNTFNEIGSSAGDDAPNNLNNAYWSTDAGTFTSNFAAGPDGIVAATRAQVSSGGRGKYKSIGVFVRNFSAWLRSTTTSTQQMVWDATLNADKRIMTATGSTTWQRLFVGDPGGSSLGFSPCDCRDFTAIGGTTAQARDIISYAAQMQLGKYPTEAILTGLTRRWADRITYPSSSDLIANQTIKFYCSFYPKYGLADNHYYNGSLLNGISSILHLWYVNSNQRAYIDTVDKKLKIEFASGGTTILPTVLSWNRLDFVEIYFEIGGGLPTKAFYKKNNGSWIDLGSPGIRAGSDIVFSNSNLHLFAGATAGDGVSNSGNLPCWLKQISFYGEKGLEII